MQNVRHPNQCSMNDPFKQARTLLPCMPEEIFELWFDGRIRANGWPPFSPTWQGALRNRPISEWMKYHWKRELIKLEINRFTDMAKDIIYGLIEAKILNIPNEYSSYPKDSRERMTSIIEYIKMNRSLPKPIILLKDGPQYEIVDGSHRLAIYFALRSNEINDGFLATDQDAWVGYCSDKDV